MLGAVSDEDVHSIIRKLVEQAMAGDVPSARELLDRVFGKPKQPVSVEDKQVQSPQVLLQQIALIIDRQPELRRHFCLEKS